MPQPKKWFEVGLLTLWIAGLVACFFILGAVVMYFKLPLSTDLKEAFEGRKAWIEEQHVDPQRQSLLHNTLIEKTKKSIQRAKVTTWDKNLTSDGYTVFSTRSSTTTYLIDMEGKIVHRWEIPFNKAWPNPPHIRKNSKAQTHINQAHVFPNGDLLVNYMSLGVTPYGYGLAKIDKDSNVLWTYDDNTHHDFYIDAHNGNIYILTQAFIRKPIDGFTNLNYPALVDYIAILSPDGKLLDKISILDAFTGTAFKPLIDSKSHGGAWWDPMHTNTVMKLEPEIADKFPMFKTGQILLSLRNINTAAVFDPESRKIIWAQKGPWKAQHATHFLENGNILLLDNRGYKVEGKNFSRVLEFNPDSRKIVWQFAGNKQQPFYTKVSGKAQRLANGNTLITETLNNRIFEITNEGKVIWSYSFPKIYSTKSTNKVHSSEYANAISNAYRYNAKDVPFVTQ